MKGAIFFIVTAPVLNKVLDEDKFSDPESAVYCVLHVKHGYLYSPNAPN
jgi:hypothetical protein